LGQKEKEIHYKLMKALQCKHVEGSTKPSNTKTELPTIQNGKFHSQGKKYMEQSTRLCRI